MGLSAWRGLFGKWSKKILAYYNYGPISLLFTVIPVSDDKIVVSEMV